MLKNGKFDRFFAGFLKAKRTCLGFFRYTMFFPLIMKHSKAIMYADDTVVYVSGKVKEDIERLLDEDLMEISKYFDQNELLINLKKGKTEVALREIATQRENERDLPRN